MRNMQTAIPSVSGLPYPWRVKGFALFCGLNTLTTVFLLCSP
ncbi:rCG41128, partial [Rattus norvegicus]